MVQAPTITGNEDRIRTVLNDRGASFWLKDALKSALQRDCVDAANDAELLAIILDERAAAIAAQRP
jgi:hypothetical protein